MTYESLYSHHCFFNTSYKLAALIGESNTAVYSSITYTDFSFASSSYVALLLNLLRACIEASSPLCAL